MNQEELQKLKEDKSIDPDRLDVEVVKQAETYYYWSEKAIKAQSKKDECKRNLDFLRSKLDGEVRSNPEDFGLSRVTESAVSAAIDCDKQIIEAEEKLIEAKEKVRLYDKIAYTMEQKKRMLELLVTLHGQQYFAGPSTPHNLTEEWQKYNKEIKENVKEKQKAKARKPKSKED